MADCYVIRVRGAIHLNIKCKYYPLRVDTNGMCYLDGHPITNIPESIDLIRDSLNHSLRGSDCYAICEFFVDNRGYITVTSSFTTDNFSEFAIVGTCKKAGKFLSAIFG